MRIFFLLLIIFYNLADVYAAGEGGVIFHTDNAYTYSIKNLSKALKKQQKKSSKKGKDKNLSYAIGDWNIRDLNSKPSSGIFFQRDDIKDSDEKQNGKASHREIIDQEHQILRHKAFDGMKSFMIPEDKTLHKLFKPKVLDTILPSFKTRIDL